VGADDFLTRPVDRTELLARVRSLLTLKQRTDELELAESSCSRLRAALKEESLHSGHCERLAEYSARLGEQLDLAEDHWMGQVLIATIVAAHALWSRSYQGKNSLQPHPSVGFTTIARCPVFNLQLILRKARKFS
jgi:hypothetical protein